MDDRCGCDTCVQGDGGVRGDRDVADDADDVLRVRRRLPVPGAWAYGRAGGHMFVVADVSYSDEDVAGLAELVVILLGGDGGERPSL